MNEPDSSTPPLPSENVRGVISLLLVIHLFAIVVALSSYTLASPLQQRLSLAVRPYLRTFNFDLLHVFPAVARLHLTHAGPYDVDFTVKGETRLPDGETASWEVPRPGLFPPVRRNRDQALANVVGSLMQSEDDREALLPRAFAAAEMRRTGGTTGVVSVTAHYLQELEDLNAAEANRRDPRDPSYYRSVFNARVIATRTGDVDLLKAVPKGEVAPVTAASGNTSKASGNSKKD